MFRADASPIIGSGHVMRSSAIAEELIFRGEEVVFVGRIIGLDWVNQRITNLGFSRIYDHTEQFSSNSDTDVLILDSYSCPLQDPFLGVDKWHFVVTIVDPVTPNYHSNLRLHLGLDSDWYTDKEIPILSGTKYIPIRKEIFSRISQVPRNKNVLNIIVISGSTDSLGLVSELALLLKASALNFKAYLFTNLIFSEPLDQRFEIVKIGPELETLSKKADLVFTSAGTSAIEFIASGLPVGIICAVKNQEDNYEKLGKFGVAAQVGLKNSLGSWEFNKNKIEELISSTELRDSLTRQASGLFDPDGASRLVDEINAEVQKAYHSPDQLLSLTMNQDEDSI